MQACPDLDALLHKTVSEKYLPGIYVVASVNGEKVLESSCGVADEEKGIKMSEGGDAIGRYYSMTKMITSLAVLMLEDEGKLNISDNISKYIPEWNDTKVVVLKDGTTEPVTRPITITDLLTHTSGLDYGFWPPSESSVAHLYRKHSLEIPTPITEHSDATEPYPRSLEDFCTKLQAIPLSYQPGVRFQYSCSTDVLGRLIECVAGSFPGYVKQSILTPLNMTDTDWTIPKEKLHRFVSCYTATPIHPDGKQYTLMRTRNVGLCDEKTPWLEGGEVGRCPSGGGGLVSTANDFLKFGELLRTGKAGDRQIVRPEVLNKMRSDYLAPRGCQKTNLASFFHGFGLGLGLVLHEGDPATYPGAGLAGPGTGAWGGAAQTALISDPVYGISIVIFAQLLNYHTTTPLLRYEITKLVYQSLRRKIVATPTQSAKGGFTG
eukprot:TRINITY_DN18666_c0_g1_i2.p1 TRINITY_DN18666_c0_g1~~TRINITY_DN18666_c0_g1_i2.p1  ORF type:complete len:454 (+),score=58.36 TRINITY_DN18666_c0_g1_i2:61-1362(+)